MKSLFKNIAQLVQDKWLLTLVVLFLFSRLFNLTILPLFTDESIYIFWAKTIVTTHSQWFISLTDGKPALLVWMIALFLKILPSDWYLIAGRLPSVLAGFVGMLGMFFLGREMSKSKMGGYLASFLYILSPFVLWYDRMALYDSLLCTSLVWTVFFTLKTTQKPSWKWALSWGIVLGISFWSKPTAVVFAVMTPFVAMTLTKWNFTSLKKVVACSLFAVATGEGINFIQRISKVYFLMEAKNSQFQQPLAELIKSPLGLTIGNFPSLMKWMIAYYTWPFFVLCLVAFAYLLIRKWKVGISLLSLWLGSILVFATFGREIFPRYILFTTPYALLAVTIFVVSLGQSKKILIQTVSLIILALCLLPQIIFDFNILTNPPKAPLPDTDFHQYISKHPSGYGLDRVFELIDEKSKTEKVTVVTQGTFGLYPYAFTLRYWSNSQVMIIPRWPLSVIDQDLYDARKDGPVYIVFKEKGYPKSEMSVEKVFETVKPGSGDKIIITKLP